VVLFIVLVPGLEPVSSWEALRELLMLAVWLVARLLLLALAALALLCRPMLIDADALFAEGGGEEDKALLAAMSPGASSVDTLLQSSLLPLDLGASAWTAGSDESDGNASGYAAADQILSDVFGVVVVVKVRRLVVSAALR
jgi:hypothetical protein